MKRKMIVVVAMILAALAAIGISAVKANAAGSPEQAACFLSTPALATQWQVSSDYFEGIYAPDQGYVVQKYIYSGNRSRSGYQNPIKLKMSLSGTNNHKITTAMKCIEYYTWDQMVDGDGAPLYYADGSPVLYQRITSAAWMQANPSNMLVFNVRGTPELGQTGFNLAAWTVGGSK